MTKQEATERMDNEGLLYTDAQMLILSFVSSDNKSKVYPGISNEQMKEHCLSTLGNWLDLYIDTKRKRDFNLNWLGGTVELGVDILREFG